MAVSTLVGNILGMAVIQVPLTPVSVNANTTVEQTFTVSGVKLTDYIELAPPSLVTGILVAESRVTAANTIAISFANVTAGPLTPPVGTYQFLVIRPEIASSTFSM